MKHNLFLILPIKREEHPNDLVIEWLCDASKGHGVGRFGASIIEHLWAIHFEEKVVAVERQRPLSSDCRPDITVAFERSLLVIENKVNAGALRADQIKLQHERGLCKQAGRPLYHVLLCPDRFPVEGYGVISDAFKVLRYSELASLLTAVAPTLADEDARSIVRQYAGYIREMYGTARPSAIHLASSKEIITRNSAERVDSREKFMAKVAEFGSPALQRAHEILLDLFGMTASLDANRFNSEGKTQALYRVYFSATDKHILRVFASGRIMVYSDILRGSSHLNQPDLADELGAALVDRGWLEPDKGDDWAPSVRKDRCLDKLDRTQIENFVAIIQATAEKVIDRLHGPVGKPPIS